MKLKKDITLWKLEEKSILEKISETISEITALGYDRAQDDDMFPDSLKYKENDCDEGFIEICQESCDVYYTLNLITCDIGFEAALNKAIDDIEREYFNHCRERYNDLFEHFEISPEEFVDDLRKDLVAITKYFEGAKQRIMEIMKKEAGVK
ncbi:MAG: hypothetical protein PWQ77_1676 [Kosmotogales bacterium]|nr:hypothetical protein [Kosmotogales bacterium]